MTFKVSNLLKYGKFRTKRHCPPGECPEWAVEGESLGENIAYCDSEEDASMVAYALNKAADHYSDFLRKARQMRSDT